MSYISKELQRKVFELTLALYRVTDFFPKNEALRKHLREKANEIFGSISEYGYSADFEKEAIVVMARIEAMRGYLDIARSMRFVKPLNLVVLGREYDFVYDFFAKELESKKQPPSRENKEKPAKKSTSTMESEDLLTWREFSAKEDNSIGQNLTKEAVSDRKKERSDVSNRQKSIIEYLKQNQQAKISDFFSFFSSISSKTIQRDLQDLVARDILKREGEKRWTVYSILMNSN